ncbi:MAG: acetoin utilization protein AcuC [Acidobacteria bacterium]|nr:acetoin utilization protein AcuC [Acidobacteriota bacterium]
MSERTALVWDEAFIAYDFGPEHPLQPVRVKLAVELSRAYGLLDRPNVALREPRSASRVELETVHVPEYLDAVERISRDPARAVLGWGIGLGDNPAFRGMHEASALIAGGSIVAAEEVWSGGAEHAFHPAGGLHHAMPDRASGFCVYNDPAIAIRWLLDQGAGRVAYVDVDVHHGDGPQFVFYEDPRVLTISLHESGRFLFPGTGFADEIGRGPGEGTKANVPLPPYTGDAAYRAAFERVVPPLLEAFRPDVLVTQLGCDTHATDPLAHLALVTQTYRWIARAFHDLAHSLCAGRWVALGGGGYQIYSVVPRAWTIDFAEMCGADLSEEIPGEWADIARARGARALPDRLTDPPLAIPAERAEDAAEGARRSAEETAARLFPYFGIPLAV